MPVVHGRFGPVSWSHFWAEMADDEAITYCDHHLGNLLEAAASGEVITGLVLSTKGSRPNAAQRKDHGRRAAR